MPRWSVLQENTHASTAMIAEKAVTALRELKDERFFLAVGFWKPHAHFNAPKKYWDLYDASRIDLADHPQPPKDVPKIALHDAREIRRAFKHRPNSTPTVDRSSGSVSGALSETTCSIGMPS